MDAAEDFVRRTLPKLTDSEVANVLKTFEDLGLETVADIPRIKESELSGCLKPLQIRRLIYPPISASARCDCPACRPKAPESAAGQSAETTATEGDSSQTEVDEPSMACPGGGYYYYYVTPQPQQYGYNYGGGCQPQPRPAGG